MMTSDSDGTKKTDSAQPPDGLWVNCPICKQPNPAGTEYCKHCWGASLHSVVAVTKQEADDFAKQWVKTKKRRPIKRILFYVLVSLILLLAVGFLYLLRRALNSLHFYVCITDKFFFRGLISKLILHSKYNMPSILCSA